MDQPDPVREQAIAWLARLRGAPSERDRAAFEDWYAADPVHADTYDSVLDSWEETARAAQTPAAQPARRPARRDWVKAAVAAAAVLLVLIAGSIVLTGGARLETSEGQLLASRVGEIRTVTLEDGSRVTLDTSSAIRVAFDDGERAVLLDHGRARFDVAHDAQRRFIVRAGTREVVAHGTVFDVARGGSTVTVSLLQGAVEVREGPSAGSSPRSIMLRPGQQLALRGEAVAAPPTAVPAIETRWPSGTLSFEDAALAEVVASANRYSATQIIVRDPAARARRFTGTFKAGDQAQLAEMIGSMFALDVAQDDARNLVIAARE